MMTRALGLAASITWAIQPEWLSTILQIANRESAGPEAVEAVERELGRPLNNTQQVSMRGDIAVVPVVGPLMRHANMFTRVSGATSIEILARDLHAAVLDPNVRAIVLNIDSPGGEIAGIHEFSNQVRAASGSKPIVAYTGGLCASAAYWIASACDEIVADATAQVGSIGVIAGVPNPDAKTAEQIEIVSSQSPEKRPDVKTKEGRASIQERVDALADVFVQVVATNRGVDTKTVLKDFGKGGMRVGQDAVDRKMVDRLGSLEGVIAELARYNEDDEEEDDDEEDDDFAPAWRRKRATGSATVRTTKEIQMSFQTKIRSVLGFATEASDEVVLARAESLVAVERDLLKVTGAQTPPQALGTAQGWKSSAEKLPDALADLGKLKAEGMARDVDTLIADAKSQNKLSGPAMETEIREIAKLSVDRARAMVAALPSMDVRSIALVKEPEATNTTIALKFEGKAYEQMSFPEKAALEEKEPKVFAQMRADWQRRGEPRL